MILRVLLISLALIGLSFSQRGRGPDKAPQPGDTIPSVSATSPDGKTTVKFTKPKRLTVLIFGSHT